MRYTSSIDMIWKEYIDFDWAGSAVDKRAPLGVSSLWDLPWFPGVAGNKLMWL
jgi:hypothetical protein